MTDKEIKLVKQAKGGSKVAFDKLYKMHVSSVRSTIKQFFKQSDLVDDLINVTFIKAYKKLQTFVTDDSFRSWLCKIANNSCIDYTRRTNKFRLQSLDDESTFLQVSETVPNAEEDIIKTEEVRNLLKCMKLLPEKQQKMLSMFYFENKLYREIADTLALPLGTVQSDLNRAKHKLKQLLTV